jgi:hypothetical protein
MSIIRSGDTGTSFEGNCNDSLWRPHSFRSSSAIPMTTRSGYNYYIPALS